jgi:hypothetical protein
VSLWWIAFAFFELVLLGTAAVQFTARNDGDAGDQIANQLAVILAAGLAVVLAVVAFIIWDVKR